MKDNRGMSMIEILVVIAILGIAVATVSLSVNLIGNTNVKTIAEEIDSNLSKVRLENMSKSEPVFIHIRKVDGSYYLSYDNSDTVSASSDLGEKIGSRKVDIFYNAGGADSLIDDEFTITFNRNGEVLYFKDGSSVSNVSGIKVTNGNKNKIVTITAAGKHFID